MEQFSTTLQAGNYYYYFVNIILNVTYINTTKLYKGK